eukprot:jgi/Mesvir1/12000/Mv00305-RA.1
MGVQGLWQLLAPVGRRVSVDALANKRVAVDASIWLVQFLKAMRDERGEMVRNAHLLGFFRRICKLLYLRIRPVFVFDGGTPWLKRRTVLARRRQRDKAVSSMRKTAEKLLLNHLKRRGLDELLEAAKIPPVTPPGGAPGPPPVVAEWSPPDASSKQGPSAGAAGAVSTTARVAGGGPAIGDASIRSSDAVKLPSPPKGTTLKDTPAGASASARASSTTSASARQPGAVDSPPRLVPGGDAGPREVVRDKGKGKAPMVEEVAWQGWEEGGGGRGRENSQWMGDDSLASELARQLASQLLGGLSGGAQGEAAGGGSAAGASASRSVAGASAEGLRVSPSGAMGAHTGAAPIPGGGGGPGEVDGGDDGDEEDEDDDEGGLEQMFLPEDLSQIDATALASLPPSMQYELLVQIRDQKNKENRGVFLEAAKAPTTFSQTQLSAYLEGSKFRAELSSVQSVLAAGARGEASRRIVSEVDREWRERGRKSEEGGSDDWGQGTRAAKPYYLPPDPHRRKGKGKGGADSAPGTLSASSGRRYPLSNERPFFFTPLQLPTDGPGGRPTNASKGAHLGAKSSASPIPAFNAKEGGGGATEGGQGVAGEARPGIPPRHQGGDEVRGGDERVHGGGEGDAERNALEAAGGDTHALLFIEAASPALVVVTGGEGTVSSPGQRPKAARAESPEAVSKPALEARVQDVGAAAAARGAASGCNAVDLTDGTGGASRTEGNYAGGDGPALSLSFSLDGDESGGDDGDDLFREVCSAEEVTLVSRRIVEACAQEVLSSSKDLPRAGTGASGDSARIPRSLSPAHGDAAMERGREPTLGGAQGGAGSAAIAAERNDKQEDVMEWEEAGGVRRVAMSQGWWRAAAERGGIVLREGLGW